MFPGELSGFGQSVGRHPLSFSTAVKSPPLSLTTHHKQLTLPAPPTQCVAAIIEFFLYRYPEQTAFKGATKSCIRGGPLEHPHRLVLLLLLRQRPPRLVLPHQRPCCHYHHPLLLMPIRAIQGVHLPPKPEQ